MNDFKSKSDGFDKIQTQDSDKEEKKILLPRTFSESDLLTTEYPAPVWIVPGISFLGYRSWDIVPGILPEGLTILAGKPKAGKTTLA